MKASLRDHLEAALEFLPLHRKKAGARRQGMHLDQLLDESRLVQTLSHSSLDLILMAYRYWHFYLEVQREFNSKKPKPEEMADLWAMGFAALLTRDQTPAELLVNDCVELAKKKFGPHTGGVSNAFFRKITRERDTLKKRVFEQPEILLGSELNARWRSQPTLKRTMAQKLLQRPPSGVEAFDATATFTHYSQEDFNQKISTSRLQSMNLGSWKLAEWIATRVELPTQSEVKILDVCAAPGGKTLALWTLFQRQGHAVKVLATDAKFSRLTQLKENVARWKLNDEIHAELADWTQSSGEHVKRVKEFSPQLVLADLPCTGLGTLHSRPDMLQDDLEKRFREIAPIQEKILKTLLETFRGSDATLVVSVCSVDPYEIESISRILGKSPEFSSLGFDPHAEGLQGWEVRKL